MTTTHLRRYSRTALTAAVLLSRPLGVAGQIPDSIPAADPALDSLLALDSLAVVDTLQVIDSIAPVPLSDVMLEHFAYVSNAYFETPGSMGLIPTGMAEAAIALEHVEIAGRDPSSLASMVANMRHVIHAIDPSVVPTGRGLGYGFKRAAEGVLTNIELATAAEMLPEAVAFHKPYMLWAATGALRRADEAIAMARQVQRSGNPEVALSRIEQLAGLVRAMAYGDDRDGDGRIGSTEEEAGLAKAGHHLSLIYRMAGIQR